MNHDMIPPSFFQSVDRDFGFYLGLSFFVHIIFAILVIVFIRQEAPSFVPMHLKEEIISDLVFITEKIDTEAHKKKSLLTTKEHILPNILEIQKKRNFKTHVENLKKSAIDLSKITKTKKDSKRVIPYVASDKLRGKYLKKSRRYNLKKHHVLEKLRKQNQIKKEKQLKNRRETLASMKQLQIHQKVIQSLSSKASHSYRQRLKKIIKIHYHLPEVYSFSKKLTCKVRLKFRLDGKIDYWEILSTSGNKIFDQMVLKAFEEASPLPPLPENLFFKEILIRFNP